MSKDVLDSGVSVTAELTDRGIKAKAKSRLLSAFDRLGGNIFELLNVPMERRISRMRAIIDGERAIVEAAAKSAVDRVGIDAEFADRAVATHFDRILRKQANVDAVLIETLEDMRRLPPPDDQAAGGPSGTEDSLDDRFIERFEHYAAGASTEELRQKWGRVLAAEVRVPGTFSEKVMRVVDELDAATATVFERINAFRLGNCWPRCLTKISFQEDIDLRSAGLLVDPPSLGTQIQIFNEAKRDDGTVVWVLYFDNVALAIDRDLTPPFSPSGDMDCPLTIDDLGRPCVPVFVLTAEAKAIASILPDCSEAAISELAKQASAQHPQAKVSKLRRIGSLFHPF